MVGWTRLSFLSSSLGWFVLALASGRVPCQPLSTSRVSACPGKRWCSCVCPAGAWGCDDRACTLVTYNTRVLQHMAVAICAHFFLLTSSVPIHRPSVGFGGWVDKPVFFSSPLGWFFLALACRLVPCQPLSNSRACARVSRKTVLLWCLPCWSVGV